MTSPMKWSVAPPVVDSPASPVKKIRLSLKEYKGGVALMGLGESGTSFYICAITNEGKLSRFDSVHLSALSTDLNHKINLDDSDMKEPNLSDRRDALVVDERNTVLDKPKTSPSTTTRSLSSLQSRIRVDGQGTMHTEISEDGVKWLSMTSLSDHGLRLNQGSEVSALLQKAGYEVKGNRVGHDKRGGV